MFKYLAKLVLLLSLLSSGAFAGVVTVSCSAPVAASTHANPVNFVCSATTTGGAHITGWNIYDSGGALVSNVPGPTAAINVNATLTVGNAKNVTVKAWDSAAATGQKIINFNVSNAATLTVSTSVPTNGTSTTSPVTFKATATVTGGNTVGAWAIYVDNVLAWSTSGPTPSITAVVSFPSVGSHAVVVQAWSVGSGVIGKSSLTVTATCVTNCNAPAPTPTPTPPPVAGLTWTSTVKTETANNTSAFDGFTGTPMNLGFGVNANVPAAANTSMVSIHSLLYAGHTTKIFLYDEPWWTSGQEGHPSCTTFSTYPQSGAGANGYRPCFSHYDIGVSSDGPIHIKRLVDLAIARGFDGESANWYGPGRIEDTSITAIMNYSDPIKKADGTPAYLMTLNVDGGMVKGCAGGLNTTVCKDTASWASSSLNSNANCGALPNQVRATYTGAMTIATDRATCYVSKMVVAGMLYANQHFFQRPSYLKNAGRPLWTWFGNETIGYTDGAGSTVHTVVIDWAYVNSVLPQVGNPITLFRNVGGFTTNMTSGGGYCWVGHDANPFDTNFDTGVAYNNSYYTSAKTTYPSKINMGCADGAFNNRDASWACGSYPNCQKSLGGTHAGDAGDFKMTSHNCGMTLITSMQSANNFYNASFQLPYLSINTYNDYEEGSAWEPGINNCWNVNTPTIDSSKILHWTLTGFDPDGASAYPAGGPEDAAHANLATVDHFTVFASDGTNAADGTPRLYVISNNVPATETTVGCKCYSLPLSAFNLPTGTYSIYVKLQSKPLIHNSWTATPVSYAAVGVGNVAPSASLTLSPFTGSAPLVVTADVSGSVDSDGTIVSKSINWGDGSASVLTGSSVTATHTYSVAGTFTVVNTVTDNGGATATATGSVTVVAAGTVLARMAVTPTSGVSPLLVSVDTSASAASSGAAITGIVISWGDGSANTTLAAGVNQATHTFIGTAGNFNVTAVVTDSASKSAQTTTVVSLVTATNGGNTITIDTLADQAFVFSPARVHATSTAGNGPVTRVQIYVDSVLVFDAQGLTANPAVIDKYVFLNVGAWHQIMVQSYDAIGQSFSTTVNVFAEGTNQ